MIMRSDKSAYVSCVEQSETIVIGNSNPIFQKALNGLSADKAIVDLVRITPANAHWNGKYHGIGW